MQQEVVVTPLDLPIRPIHRSRFRSYYHFRELENDRSNSMPDINNATAAPQKERIHFRQRSATSPIFPEATTLLPSAKSMHDISNNNEPVEIQIEEIQVEPIIEELPIDTPPIEKKHARTDSWIEQVGKKIHQRQEKRRNRILAFHEMNANQNYLLNTSIRKSSKATASLVEAPSLTTAYIMFRKEKIRNPFIRSRLLRTYVQGIKSRYEPITKWLNHIKVCLLHND